MALVSSYKTGTATATNGSPTVTGSGTSWASAVQPGDFFFGADGRSAEILTVNSNTSITLDQNWPGTSQTGGIYRIRFGNPASTVQATTRELLEELTNGNLQAFAGLTGAADRLGYFTGAGAMSVTAFTSGARALVGLAGSADKVPYFTGAGAAALMTVSSAARNVLDDASAADMLATLGAVPLAGGTMTGSLFGSVFEAGAFSLTGVTNGVQVNAGAISSSRTVTTSTNRMVICGPNGQIGSITGMSTTTTFNTTSDERLKDFIGPYDPEEAIAIIRADPVREFTWRVDGSLARGWGAQTSYAVSPDLASPPVEEGEIDDEGTWGMDHSRRTPYLWAAMTGVLGKIEALELRLAALEAT